MYAFGNQNMLRNLMMNPYSIKNKKQYYRLVTSGFVHVDHMHLIFNMFSFYFFGSAMEMILNALFGVLMGDIYFTLLYILAIIVSDLPTYFKHKNEPRYNSLGASGGVAAVIFASIIFSPLQSICIYFAICMPGIVFGILYVAFSYYQGKRSRDNINHDAHLYGAVFGILFCIVIYPSAIVECYHQILHWREL